MRFSLAALLAFGLAGLQLVAVLAVVFTSYLTSERALLEQARSQMSDVGTNAAEHSKGFLNPARGAAELAARLAQHRVVASDNHDQLEQFLFQQLRIAPQFSGLYYGGEDGSFLYVMRSDGPAPFRTKAISLEGAHRDVDFVWRDDAFRPIARSSDPDDDYDPRDRPWYLRAKQERTTIWTEPYIFFSSQQPGITLAAPVLDEGGKVQGVIGVDIEIDNISRFLSRLRIGTHGRALIINRNGDVIAHPDQSLIKTREADGSLRFVNIDEIGDPIARAAFSGFTDGRGLPVAEERFSQLNFEGSNYVATVLPAISAEMRWTIAIYAPEDDFIGTLKQNRAVNLWIAVAVSLVTGIGGLFLATYIYRPVRAFAVRSALISQGEIDPSEPLPRTYKELAQANETLVHQIVARKEAEREYGQTFDLSSRAMAQVSAATGRLLKVNARLCEITGYQPGELLAMHFADLVAADEAALPPMPGLDADWAARVASGEAFATNSEVWIRCRNGARVSLAMNAILIRDQDGQPLHAVVTLDDMTEKKARETEIARLNRDLSHLARGNTMGQMAAGLAHELNQPLSSIAQNADTGQLVLDRDGVDSAELREILTEIEQQSLRAGEIIRALRGFISKDEILVSSFDLAELLEQARRLVQPEASEAGVRIIAAMPKLPPVRANRVQVAQVFVNLLRNAIEAIAGSGGTAGRITVRARRLHNMIEVEVEDNGPGINPDIKLFSQFETTKAAGMGLGLSICRSMIEANGGRLDCDRSCRQGARFRFSLVIDERISVRSERVA